MVSPLCPHPSTAQPHRFLPLQSAAHTAATRSSSSQPLRSALRCPPLLQRDSEGFGLAAGSLGLGTSPEAVTQWACMQQAFSPGQWRWAEDVSLTWGTIQLLQCLAAALWLYLCPLAKEGETDVT